MHIPFQRFFSSKARVFWILVLLTIPLLSVFGRPLQRLLGNQVSATQLAVLFLICNIGLLAALATIFRNTSKQYYFHLAWGALFFLGAPFLLETVVERLHFIVFGLFGFLTVLSFGFRPAVIICVMVGGLDELLQWFLPDRVGDWRDVGFNWLASAGGYLLARKGTLLTKYTKP